MPPQNLPLNNPNQSTSNRPLVQVSGCTAPKMGQGTRRGVWSCGHWYHSFDAQPLPQCFVPRLKIQRFHLNLPLSCVWRVNQSDSHTTHTNAGACARIHRHTHTDTLCNLDINAMEKHTLSATDVLVQERGRLSTDTRTYFPPLPAVNNTR